jgi:hypothetical protein
MILRKNIKMKPQLFILDFDPTTCAQSYTDTHLVEYIPILIEVMRAVDAEKHPFKNHILAKWCGSKSAYNWVNILVAKMIKEAEHRFAVDTEKWLEDLHTLEKRRSDELPSRWLQLIPKPISGKPVEAYQRFYITTQQGSTWTKRQVPKWFTGAVQQSLF